MNIADMWKSNLAVHLLLIVVNLALFSLGNTPWIVLGLICLALGMFYSFRQGMSLGHRACGILQTVERSMEPDSPTHGQLDKRVVAQAWSVSRGIRAALACALLPYALGCAYIVCALLGLKAALPLRLISWVVALPFWPVVLPWYQTFDRLTGVVAAVLMISPFVLPACGFAGYMQGPKLWAKSEKAMAEGRRRAKAKSRVQRKKTIPRSQRPEI